MPPDTGPRSLVALARACARHPGKVLGVWIILAALLIGLGAGVGTAPKEAGGLPGSASGAAEAALASHGPLTGPAGGPGANTASLSITSPAVLPLGYDGVADLRQRLAGADRPFTDVGMTVAAGGHTAFLWFSTPDRDPQATTRSALAAARAWVAASPSRDGLRVAPVNGVDAGGTSNGLGEKVGLGVAALVLVAAFGSVVAAGVPLIAAVVGVAATLASVRLLALVAPVTPAGPQLATMIGLGVGIDYALLLLTRFREQMAAARLENPAGPGAPLSREALLTCGVVASVRAGSAVLVAGLTVAVAVLGLSASGIPDITSLGWTTVVAVGFAVAAALTLAPALLALLGERLGRRQARHRRPTRSHVRWTRHIGRVTQHPVRWAVGSVLALGLLSAPLAGLSLGEAHPQAVTGEKRAFTTVTDTLGSGALTPVLLVATSHQKVSVADLASIDTVLETVPGVTAIGRNWHSADGDVVGQEVLNRAAPGEPAENSLVNRLRDSTLPAITATHPGLDLGLAGASAAQADLEGRVVARLPLFAGAVLFACLLVLACAFRSVLVPLKAVAVTMLSVGASAGVVVCVVQWGWLRDVVGLHSTQPISAYVPMFLIAIVLGLSMDYEVFLVARIREHYLQRADTRSAVVRGTAGTARTITSAAAIMVSVFLAFTLSPSPAVKVMGLGLATAVALDATVVRMVLVPASMTLMGKLNWWMPRWLDRLLPQLALSH